jgi:hypothetical protein
MTLPDWPLAGWVVLAALVAWVSAGVVMVIDLAWEIARAVWHYGRAR